jgi:adenylyltransferase/sulfurtransferase
MGGLGSPSALYLAAAGVGTLGLLDPDTVSLSNLQRQVLYSTADVGKPKVLAARERLLALNPECRITAHQGALTQQNAESLMAQYDLVLDGTDDLETKFLINDTARKLAKPWILASVTGFDAQIACFSPGEPDYRSVFRPDPGVLAQDCTRAGVIGAFAGMIGARQAFEAVTWIASGLGRRKAILSTLEAGLEAAPTELRLEIPERSSLQAAAETQPRESPRGVVIDVRSEAEWAADPRPGALHWALSRLEAGQFPDLPAETPIVLACKSGVRARQAQVLLAQKGYFSTSCL